MPLLNSLAKIAAKPLPRRVSAGMHSRIDYLSVGTFLATAAVFRRRNKRASLAALVSGGAELALMLLTDYPGGVKPAISFQKHREMDYGLAAMVATMPETLSFKGAPEAKFFRVQGALITLLGEVTERPLTAKERSRSRAA